MSFIYITCKDRKEAKKISIDLLKKKLIACANISPIESLYWWNNKIVNEREYVLLGKTEKKKYAKIKKEVKKIHSYKIPCICLLPSEANEEYAKWMKKQIE